jgi:hypothetical protein
VQKGGAGLVVTSASTSSGGAIKLQNIGGDLTLVTANIPTIHHLNLSTLNSGNIFVGSGTTKGALTASAAGYIAEYGDDVDIDLSAGTEMILTAGKGVGPSATIEIGATLLTVVGGSGSGSVPLINLENVAAVGSTVTINQISASSGYIKYWQKGGGDLIVTNAFTANGPITLQNTGGNLTVTNAVVSSAHALNLLTVGSGNLLVGRAVTDGAIGVSAAGFIYELGSDAEADFSAGSITLRSAKGIGTAENPIETHSPSLTSVGFTGIAYISRI